MIDTGLQEDPVQVAPMHHGIGIAEPGPECLIQRNSGDLLPAQGIHEAQIVDIDRHCPGRVTDTEIIECMERVRPQLDARANLPEFRRLLQNDGTDALLRQPDRRGQPADTATGDDNPILALHSAAPTVRLTGSSPSMPPVMTSPGMTGPTPAGVPVMIRSPGRR